MFNSMNFNFCHVLNFVLFVILQSFLTAKLHYMGIYVNGEYKSMIGQFKVLPKLQRRYAGCFCEKASEICVIIKT